MRNLSLVWEEATDDKVGLHKLPKKVNLTMTLLKKLAISKMVGPRLISADFLNEPVSFRPRVCLLLEKFSTLNFIGIYYSDEFDDVKDSSFDAPSLCVRVASWDGKQDIAKFQSADDKDAYILGSEQTSIRNLFCKRENYSDIMNLVSDSIALIQGGVVLQENTEVESEYSEVNFIVSEGSFRYDFAHDPRSYGNIFLDELIEKWIECLDGCRFENLVVPDANFRVSYNLSMFDQIEVLKLIN
jgi:hypothetical protein